MPGSKGLSKLSGGLVKAIACASLPMCFFVHVGHKDESHSKEWLFGQRDDSIQERVHLLGREGPTQFGTRIQAH